MPPFLPPIGQPWKDGIMAWKIEIMECWGGLAAKEFPAWFIFDMPSCDGWDSMSKMNHGELAHGGLDAVQIACATRPSSRAAVSPMKSRLSPGCLKSRRSSEMERSQQNTHARALTRNMPENCA